MPERPFPGWMVTVGAPANRTRAPVRPRPVRDRTDRRLHVDGVADPLVAAILPPKEGFGPGLAGGIGMMVVRYTATPGFRTLVIGGSQDGPTFPNVAFRTVRPAIWCPGNINIRFAAGMLGTLRAAGPALIEVHNRPEIALALSWLLPGIPVALLLHNDPQGMRAARSPAARERLLRRLASVTTVSDFLRRRFMEGVAVTAGTVGLLHNCMDLDIVPPAAERQRLILFAGRVVRDKGPDIFIQACARALPSLPGWRAEVIGADGMSATGRVTDYVREIQAMAADATVAMPGYRDHRQVLEAMTRAAMVVVPSRWDEPFGLVALEAMACGAPLIVSPRGGLTEVAGSAAVYADPENPDAIAAAIVALATDPARREALSAAGRERARMFDVRCAAARLAELRLGILNRALPSGA